MQIHKVTFKNLTEEQSFDLFQLLKQFNVAHDLEIMDDNFEFDEHTKTAYKIFKKALEQQKEKVFKQKHNII